MPGTKPRLHAKTVYRAYLNGPAGLQFWTGRAFDGRPNQAVALSARDWRSLYKRLTPAEQLHAAAYKELVHV